MINKIGKITIYVQNQEEAKDFWVHKLGFVIKMEQPMGPNATWLEVAPNENDFTTLVLYSKSLMEEQQPGKSTAHPAVIFSATNIDKSYAKMQENGIKVGELMKLPFGSMFQFYDQDGNEYLLREDK